MVRRVSLVALVALASTAAAQTSPPPVSPVIACQQQGQAEQTRLLKLARDSGKAPDVTATVNANKAITRECAAKIDAASGSAKDRVDLANLYLGTNDTTKAESIINGMLKAK